MSIIITIIDVAPSSTKKLTTNNHSITFNQQLRRKRMHSARLSSVLDKMLLLKASSMSESLILHQTFWLILKA